MKKIKIYTLFLFIGLLSIKAFSQNINSYIVSYERTTDLTAQGIPEKFTFKSKLIGNDKESIYEVDFSNKDEKGIELQKQSDNNLTLKLSVGNNQFAYKDFTIKEQHYLIMNSIKDVIIEEPIQIFNWELTANKKEILGYECQEAILKNYRGRDYKAYFAIDIPITNGPWIFGNLPGIILEITTLDGYYKAEAKKIALNVFSQNSSIQNPYKNKETTNWEDFKKMYQKKYDEIIRNSMTEFGPSIGLSKKNLFEYIEE